MACESVLRDRSLVKGEPVFIVHHDLSATPAAAPRARHLVADTLAMAGTPVMTDETVYTAQLLVSELVTNAVMHARTDLHLGITCDEDVLLITVADGHPQTPLGGMSADPDYEESGRGMDIVASLADDFGWRLREDAPGKVMWVVLAVTHAEVPRKAEVRRLRAIRPAE